MACAAWLSGCRAISGAVAQMAKLYTCCEPRIAMTMPATNSINPSIPLIAMALRKATCIRDEFRAIALTVPRNCQRNNRVVPGECHGDVGAGMTATVHCYGRSIPGGFFFAG